VRTTLDIDPDVLQAAKELAKRDGTTTGEMLSTLARRGLASSMAVSKSSKDQMRGGVPVLPSRGEIITLEEVQRIADEEGQLAMRALLGIDVIIALFDPRSRIS